MKAIHAVDPCAGDGACFVPPAEFVRLRYFFGQRLGVVDLADEQSYLAGKQRFHNLRAHGVGVLCGLRAERYVFPQGSPATSKTTLLRVRRGAALDGCGREIVVGWDQCIDVAAWFAQHPSAAPSAGTTFQLWVALRYRECPSDPAPAPRDSCGCDAAGCEFARIREGFELMLLTDEEAKECVAGGDPGVGGLLIADEALGGPLDAAIARAVTLHAAGDCPDPTADPCLLLANFEVTLDAVGKKVVDITAPDDGIPERRTLLPTAALQAGLLSALAAAAEGEMAGSGPHFGAVSFSGGTADSGKLSIEIKTNGEDLSRDPLTTPAQITVSVSRFKDDGTWEAAPSFTTSFSAGPPAAIDLDWGSGLADGGRYRAFIESDRVQPPVDKKMRPLAPPTWARHFRLVADSGGNLILADQLYA